MDVLNITSNKGIDSLMSEVVFVTPKILRDSYMPLFKEIRATYKRVKSIKQETG